MYQTEITTNRICFYAVQFKILERNYETSVMSSSVLDVCANFQINRASLTSMKITLKDRLRHIQNGKT